MTGSRRTRGIRAVLVTLLLVLFGVSVSTGAWAIWTISSTVGGSGAALAASVNAGSVPTVVADGSSMIVTWSASTLSNGSAVSGYRVTRYSTGLVAQTVVSNCAGTITNLGCIENNVPLGTWTYTVTPLVGANWVGAESAVSAPVTSNGVPPTNTVWMWVTP